MRVVLALRFVWRDVPLATTGNSVPMAQRVRVLQQQTGEVEIDHMTASLVVREFEGWKDVPLVKTCVHCGGEYVSDTTMLGGNPRCDHRFL